MAQVPLLPPLPKKVAEEPAYIPVSLKILMEAPRADSDDMMSPKKQVKNVISIAPIIGMQSQARG